MAIAAEQLHDRPIWPLPDRLHVNRMIQLELAGILRAVAQGRKFWMPMLETLNLRRVVRLPASHFQISVALRATLVARGNQVNPSAMLAVARRAIWHRSRNLIFVVHRPVMASLASAIRRNRRKPPSLRHMARRALLLEHCVRLAHPAAGVHSRIPRKAPPRNPSHS